MNIELADNDMRTVRHIKYNRKSKTLEAICYVGGNDVRARFKNENGRTTTAYLKNIEFDDVKRFVVAVKKAIPGETFKHDIVDDIMCWFYRLETLTADERPRGSKKGFGQSRSSVWGR